jgi:Ni,Fe-hydrogenase III large subunit/Ni,Fe-hydrogenase III component G
MTEPVARVIERCRSLAEEIYPLAPQQLRFVITDAHSLAALWAEIQESKAFRLVTAFGNDERDLEPQAIKLYCIFACDDRDLFLWLEYRMNPAVRPDGEVEFEYPHLAAAAFVPFQKELADFLGAFPETPADRGQWRRAFLHAPYPDHLWPLRRDRTLSNLSERIRAHTWTPNSGSPSEHPGMFQAPDCEIIPVGPIHAGIIPAGRFLFRTKGEAIQVLNIGLGYCHKGLERLFQDKFTLVNGWKLAERVAGDSSVAHSMAYCQAVEALAGVEPPRPALLLRALFLELERISNHFADLAAIAHDVALDVVASNLSEMRELNLRLHQRICGHRLLRGVNRPGGVQLTASFAAKDVSATLDQLCDGFETAARRLVEFSGFRERAIEVGKLSPETAWQLGATGFVARASGHQRDDYRFAHPFGLYRERRFEDMAAHDALERSKRLQLRGDVFARTQLRMDEVLQSFRLAAAFLGEWDPGADHLLLQPGFEEVLRQAPNFTSAMGYVEGWRGNIVYWIMKDKFERIFRCKVRDPSTLNWPALAAAIQTGAGGPDTLVGDFPLINKSFNLSYSGNDL